MTTAKNSLGSGTSDEQAYNDVRELAKRVEALEEFVNRHYHSHEGNALVRQGDWGAWRVMGLREWMREKFLMS